MKMNSVILLNEDKFKLISKTEPNLYCVFIQPDSVNIFQVKNAIEELKLSCTDSTLFVEDLILETYEEKAEAENRIMNFTGQWLEQFHVSCYKNGEFISENRLANE